MNIHPKVAASSVTAAAVSVILWVAKQVGVDMPVEVAGAIVVVATFAAGYLKAATGWVPKA